MTSTTPEPGEINLKCFKRRSFEWRSMFDGGRDSGHSTREPIRKDNCLGKEERGIRLKTSRTATKHCKQT